LIKECIKCGVSFDAEEDRFDLCRNCQVVKRVNEAKFERLLWDYHYVTNSNSTAVSPSCTKHNITND
jgi:hypothetical protein